MCNLLLGLLKDELKNIVLLARLQVNKDAKEPTLAHKKL